MSVRSSRFVRAALLCAVAGAWAAGPLHAAGQHNPTSKLYVADVDGDSQIDTGVKVDDLTKQSVYNAQGTVVETKPNGTNALVFSNGTGIFFDEDTRVEVKRFQQEPFVPNRTDMDVEPSISQTQSYVPRGTVGLCTSKLVAGSSMTYSTPLGSLNILGGKMVVTSENNRTVFSVLDGQGSVSAGGVDTGGQVLQGGQQAVITPGANGGPPQLIIQDIPASQRRSLEQKVTMACNAKKTVYFEVRNRRSNPDAVSPLNPHAAFASNDAGDAGGGITAFDGDDGATNAAPSTPNGPSNGTPTQEIVAVPVAPANTPVQYTQSPANLVTSTPATP